MLHRYLNQVPFHSRPAFFFESLYSVGRGVFVELFFFCPVILKAVLDGELWHLTVLGCIWGGSGMLAPYVAYLGRRIEMRGLVIWPNVIAGLAFFCVALVSDANGFLVLVSVAYLVGLFARVAEMSLYRAFYPPTHRSLAVGWLKSIAFVAGGVAVLAATGILAFRPEGYWMLFTAGGALLLGAAYCYGQIRIPATGNFLATDDQPPHRVLSRALATLKADRRFLFYQSSFFLSGFANHMSTMLVAEVLRETLGSGALFMALTFSLIPTLLRACSAPLWGPLLDRISPMTARAIFNVFLMATYSLYCFGGVTLEFWPFVVGAILHGIGQGGNQINWTTSSLYFAGKQQVPLYNSVHVALTGMRGLIAPLVGAWLFSTRGWGSWVFGLSVLLGALGFAGMVLQARFDSGPQEEREDVFEEALRLREPAEPVSR